MKRTLQKIWTILGSIKRAVDWIGEPVPYHPDFVASHHPRRSKRLGEILAGAYLFLKQRRSMAKSGMLDISPEPAPPVSGNTEPFVREGQP